MSPEDWSGRAVRRGGARIPARVGVWPRGSRRRVEAAPAGLGRTGVAGVLLGGCPRGPVTVSLGEKEKLKIEAKAREKRRGARRRRREVRRPQARARREGQPGALRGSGRPRARAGGPGRGLAGRALAEAST